MEINSGNPRSFHSNSMRISSDLKVMQRVKVVSQCDTLETAKLVKRDHSCF